MIYLIRLKYACKDENCEGVERAEGERAVKIAPVPLQLIPKGKVTNLEGFGKAGEAVKTIRNLYAIERKACAMDLPPELKNRFH